MSIRARIARRLRYAADRIDPDGAPRMMTMLSFTFEPHEGIRIRRDGRGCPLWYLGAADYQRAHSEGGAPARTMRG
jgi:hypothetical protein